jgi:hypothetical protein
MGQQGQTALLLPAFSQPQAGKASVLQAEVATEVSALAESRERLVREVSQQEQILVASATAQAQAFCPKAGTTSAQAVLMSSANRRAVPE